MIKLNKYLRELGLTEENYPFNIKPNDERYVEDSDGFRECEFFSLDYTLSLYIYSQLCYFKEHCLRGIPFGFEPEQWEVTIDKMIEAFKLIILEQTDSKTSQKKIRYGLRLFVKYFRHLWF